MSTYFDSPKIIFNEKSIDVTTPHFQRLHVSIKLKTVTLNNTFKYSDKIVLLNNIQSKSKHLNSKMINKCFNQIQHSNYVSVGTYSWAGKLVRNINTHLLQQSLSPLLSAPGSAQVLPPAWRIVCFNSGFTAFLGICSCNVLARDAAK